MEFIDCFALLCFTADVLLSVMIVDMNLNHMSNTPFHHF